MAERRKGRGLGRGLDYLLDQADGAGDPRVPGEDTSIDKTDIGLNRLIPSGNDFGPYTVEEADVYFQGPSRSTRVQAHQFIPDIDPTEWRSKYGLQFSWDIPGTIYVRFWKNNTLWKYGPCTLREYQTFRDSASKGRSVRALEAFPHGAASMVEGLEI
jgi:hypothetical protein